MKKKPEQAEQTPQGVRLQGTMLLCLAVAMVIAGSVAAYMHWQDVGNVNQFQQQENQQHEEVKDTQDNPVDTSSGGTDSGGDAGSATPADVTVLAANDGYCNVVMVGEANNYSEVATPDNTMVIDAELCISITASLMEAVALGILPPERAVFPEGLAVEH